MSFDELGLNLLMDLGTLTEQLRLSLTAGDSLDAFLLGAGVEQVTADYLGRDTWSLRVAAAFLGHAHFAGRAQAATVARGLSGIAQTVRGSTSSDRSVAAWHTRVSALVEALAEAVVAGSAKADLQRLQSESILADVATLPIALLQQVIKLPRCFHSFDQRPEDCRRLACQVAERWPERKQPVTVVGVRTSGAYLAPLVAAELRQIGYVDVRVLTFRPNHRLSSHQRWIVRKSRSRRALTLIVDDPPKSGMRLAETADYLQGRGIRREQLVLVLALLGPTNSLPRPICDFDTVLLPWDQWSVHDRFTEQSIAELLDRLIVKKQFPVDQGEEHTLIRSVETVDRIHQANLPGDLSSRGHIAIVYRVTLAIGNAPAAVEVLIRAEWTGVGYYARHRELVARRLAPYLPVVYGVEKGVLVREWIVDSQNPASSVDEADAMSTYVFARARALATPEDMSIRLSGRAAAWELAAHLIGQAFGRLWPVIRPLAHSTARRLLQVNSPAVIDGRTGLTRWLFVPSGDGRVLAAKASFGAGSFTNMDSCCYDPIYDLAMPAADRSVLDGEVGSEPPFGTLLRDAFERQSQAPVGAERWLLYRLLRLDSQRAALDKLWPALAAGTLSTTERSAVYDEWGLAHLSRSIAFERRVLVERAMSRCIQEYFAEVYLRDLRPPEVGPVCAIDIDGVLEGSWLSVPAIGPSGALAVRALLQHGWRPLLATGRSAAQLAERCHNYRLAGGVAEYGAVVYDSRLGSFDSSADSSEVNLMLQLAKTLRGMPDVFVEPGWRHVVRASRLDDRGLARPLRPEDVDVALRAVSADGRIGVVRARTTDFTVARLNKATGLVAWLARHESQVGGHESSLQFAVGDSLSDLPMLELAHSAFAPASADRTLIRAAERAEVHLRVARAPYGRGLFEAVTEVLRHRPGDCTQCAMEAMAPETALLLTALAALDGGKGRLVRQAGALAWCLRSKATTSDT